MFPQILISKSCSSKEKSADEVRDAPQKNKRDFLGIFPKCRTPPLPPFWEPVFSKKKVWFILHFRPLGAFLVFTKMFTFGSILLFKSFGNRWPPKKLPVFTFGNTGPPQNFHVSAYKKWNGKYKIVLGIAKTPPPLWEKFPKNPVYFFWERPLRSLITLLKRDAWRMLIEKKFDKW